MSFPTPSYTPLELDFMRAGFVFSVLYALEHLSMAAGMRNDRAYPVGLARLLDLGFVFTRRRFLHRAGQVAALAYLLEAEPVWALLAVAAILVVFVTAVSSSGSVHHGHHLVTIVAVAQLAAMALWNAADRFDWDLSSWFGPSREAAAAWWAVQGIVAAYFTSGLTKVFASGGAWLFQAPGLLVATAVRVEMMENLGPARQRRAGRMQRLLDRMLPHVGLARLLFGAGLIAELIVPIGLLHENLLLVVGLAAILLHRANDLFLGLPFHNYQVLVLVFLVNLPRFWA